MTIGSTIRTRGALAACLFALFAMLLTSSSALAQADSNPKWDLFAGYQYMHPGTTIPFGDPSNPTTYKVPDMVKGLGGALTYNFQPRWGIEFDLGYNNGSNNSESTVSVGPRFMWRTDDVNFFAHALVGGNFLFVSGVNTGTNSAGAIFGGGIDLPINKSFSFRLIEADFVFAHHNYSTIAGPLNSNLGHPATEGARLRTGIVYSWGGEEALAPAAACTVQPAEVMVGEPITANVTASNFNPKHTVTYSWSGNGASGSETAAKIDTSNMAPGSYTVTAHATDPRTKKNNEATCSANYTVKPLPPKNPPTMSLSANPSSVVTGGSVSLSANCTSPDSVPVSVANWTSSAGTVSGSGSSATLNTAGVDPGTVTVGATCTDSRGLTGQASAQVGVEKPPLPPVDKALEARLSLHSVYFPTAQPTPKDPNGGLVASQEKILTELAADFQTYLKSKPDAHLILEGHADPRGSVKFNQALSERRVARVKSFLVEHGVPEGIIETKALGDQHNLTPAEVKAQIESDQQLTKEERARILRNMQTIILASNRRVDSTLSTTGEVSKRTFPFNAEDALTLIGGRTAERKAAAPKKKAAPKK